MSYKEIRERVEQNGNVVTVGMDELREAEEAGRLGPHVCRRISDRLAGEGLGHTPRDLPADSWQYARVYKLGTPVARLVNAVEEPGQSGDDTLREQASGEAGKVLEDIRALVC